MTIGRKTRLRLQRYLESRDEYSSVTRLWVNKMYIKGVLVPASGEERLSLDKLTVYGTNKFFCDIPKNETITEKDRFTLGTRTFEIKSIDDPDNGGIRYEILLKEIV